MEHVAAVVSAAVRFGCATAAGARPRRNQSRQCPAPDRFHPASGGASKQKGVYVVSRYTGAGAV